MDRDDFIARCLAGRDEIRLRSANLISRNHLTPHEAEVLGLLRSAMSMADIAAALHISINTLKSHRRSLYRKLGAANRREAIRLADLLTAGTARRQPNAAST